MKAALITISFGLFLQFACKNAGPVKEEAKNPILALKGHFRDFNLSAFQLDSFEWLRNPRGYKVLDSNMFSLVWQGGERTYDPEQYTLDFLYSWQERDSSLTEFTVATFDETYSGSVLEYLIYDRQGKMKGHFTAAANCADGDWTFTAYGKFIDRNTYQSTSIEEEITGGGDATDSTKSYYLSKVDSTVINYTIGKTGNVMEKQVSKKSFEKKHYSD